MAFVAFYSQPGPFLGLLLLLGLLVGSFLNVLIYRLPRMLDWEWRAMCADMRGEAQEGRAPLNLFRPRSHCPHCQHPIAAYDNMPVLSWLLLRGRCRHCGTAISGRYPVVELLSGLLAAGAALHFGPGVQALEAALFLWCVLALTLIDVDSQLLPDQLTLPLLWLGLLFNVSGHWVPLADAVLGAMAGYLSLWSVYWLFKWATGKEGMGYGDFKLLAAIGAWLGWLSLPIVLLLASVVGALVGVALVVGKGHDRHVPIPFGPYLAAAGAIALFWGPQLQAWYLGG